VFSNAVICSGIALWICFMVGIFMEDTLAERLASGWIAATLGALLYLLLK